MRAIHFASKRDLGWAGPVGGHNSLLSYEDFMCLKGGCWKDF